MDCETYCKYCDDLDCDFGDWYKRNVVRGARDAFRWTGTQFGDFMATLGKAAGSGAKGFWEGLFGDTQWWVIAAILAAMVLFAFVA